MTELNWREPGDNLFELGVDRGVLYIDGMDGVPWLGLTAVREAPIGGEPRPYYVDGYKYLNISSFEEYAATIDAFSAPPEFGVCDGLAQVQKGLFFDQQPRKSFGFSYRTLVGNDLEGSDYGYKIHLVYNALASPSPRERTTMGDTVDPMGLAWSFATKPVRISGFRQTAHVVIDSTTANPIHVAAVENILYGTEELAPRLLTPQELMTIFEWDVPNTQIPVSFTGAKSPTIAQTKNLKYNSSFEDYDPFNMVEVARNYHRNPRAQTVDGYSSVFDLPDFTIDTTTEAAAESGRCVRVFWTNTGVVGAPSRDSGYFGINMGVGSVDTPDMETETTYTVAWRSRLSGSRTLTPPSVKVGTGVIIEARSHDANMVVPSNNEFTRWVTFTTSTSTDPIVIGDTILNKVAGDAQLIWDVDIYPGAYRPDRVPFSGDTADVGDFQYDWVGTANLSPSTKSGRSGVSSARTGDGGVIQSGEWALTGTKSARIVQNLGQYSSAYYDIPHEETEPFSATVLATGRIDQTGLLTETDYRRCIALEDSSTEAFPNIPGAYTQRITAMVDPGSFLQVALLGDYDKDVWWDDVLIVINESPEYPYSGPYFDGTTAPFVAWNQIVTPAWTDDEVRGMSEFFYIRDLRDGKVGDLCTIDGGYWFFSDAGYWIFIGHPFSGSY